MNATIDIPKVQVIETRAQSKRAWRERERERGADRDALPVPRKPDREAHTAIPIGVPKIRMERPTFRDARRGRSVTARLVSDGGAPYRRSDAKPWQTPKGHQR